MCVKVSAAARDLESFSVYSTRGRPKGEHEYLIYKNIICVTVFYVVEIMNKKNGEEESVIEA